MKLPRTSLLRLPHPLLHKPIIPRTRFDTIQDIHRPETRRRRNRWIIRHFGKLSHRSISHPAECDQRKHSTVRPNLRAPIAKLPRWLNPAQGRVDRSIQFALPRRCVVTKPLQQIRKRIRPHRADSLVPLPWRKSPSINLIRITRHPLTQRPPAIRRLPRTKNRPTQPASHHPNHQQPQIDASLSHSQTIMSPTTQHTSRNTRPNADEFLQKQTKTTKREKTFCHLFVSFVPSFVPFCSTYFCLHLFASIG